jgi:SAM-dependent methyltransferase
MAEPRNFYRRPKPVNTVSQWDRLESRRCPVCDSGPEDATIFLKQALDPSRINAYSYASRKTPEFMRFELVTCRRCNTVYATSAPPKAALTQAYSQALYDSADEARLASDTYAEALAPYLATLPSRMRALEIGTGTGVFLSPLQRAGFSEVIGIEPSRAAIDAAEPAVRPLIREGIFVEADFEASSFDLICCFQTLEHVPEPRALVESCSQLLRKGGILALVTHDYRAPINRLLGRKSPIIDIEHLQIFCRPSLERLLSTAGLQTVAIEAFANRYRMNYWLRLAPIPAALKPTITKIATATGIGGIKLRLNVGNLISIGRKAA